MTTRFIPLCLASVALVVLAGCPDDSDPVDTDTTDAATDTVPDTAPDTVTDTLTDTADADPEDTAPGPDVPVDDLGFAVRVPVERSITCSDYPDGYPEEPLVAWDTDWVCTFVADGYDAHVYVQASVTDCTFGMGALPAFGDVSAWIAFDGAATPLSGASYDYGGGHNNDWVEFTYAGAKYSLDHSSFGFGWRKCQPMDCVKIRDLGGTLVEDGCTMERTLPIVCQPVQGDGTYGAFVDTFEPCEGDPNFP